jgi:hypothetical protein
MEITTHLLLLMVFYYDFNRFQDIDPNNIADITVLKGLAASALYGQEGQWRALLQLNKSGGSKQRAFYDCESAVCCESGR